MRLGRPETPVVLDAARLNGSFAGSNLRGDFSGGNGTIGNIPLRFADASGKWQYRGTRLASTVR